MRPLPLAVALAVFGSVSFGSVAEQPSGTLAFVSSATTRAVVLWTVRADGAGSRKLTEVQFQAEAEPEWSPTGGRIAFSRGYNCRRALYGTCSAIWTANPDGSVQERLTPLKHTGQLAKRAVDFYHPTWSPDGQRIAYVQEIWMTGTSNLYVMNADGSGRRRLTRLSNVDGPAWSPDGSKIAFTHVPNWRAHDDPPHQAEIYVLVLDTGEVRRLTRTLADESLPQWSPEGTRIAYEHSGRFWEYEVFVTNADGTERRNLSRRRDVVDGSPVWSPQGELIAFVSDRQGEEPAIYIAAADGMGRAAKVTTPEVSLYELDWTAAG